MQPVRTNCLHDFYSLQITTINLLTVNQKNVNFIIYVISLEPKRCISCMFEDVAIEIA